MFVNRDSPQCTPITKIALPRIVGGFSRLTATVFLDINSKRDIGANRWCSSMYDMIYQSLTHVRAKPEGQRSHYCAEKEVASVSIFQSVTERNHVVAGRWDVVGDARYECFRETFVRREAD
ncbi:hypothetical protein IEO21_03248 [Rhodonia placenta]|uniref:Uncharacterized protein n=1 Tax=Rhodonia placenta TaxID=104341 RepID=A0A8H7P628_9APHY|nr:hypothetical protein IEO21_03248 [Postia placenta]